MMRTLTKEEIKKVEIELQFIKSLLADQIKRTQDLLYFENVNFYKKHILKLENMLSSKQF
jgi:hypothetical protein